MSKLQTPRPLTGLLMVLGWVLHVGCTDAPDIPSTTPSPDPVVDVTPTPPPGSTAAPTAGVGTSTPPTEQTPTAAPVTPTQAEASPSPTPTAPPSSPTPPPDLGTATPSTPIDQDLDGSFSELDCNDQNPNIYPGATEICNGADDNCDDAVDEGLTITAFQDLDSDGFGKPDTATPLCSLSSGYTTVSGDCNDLDPAIHPNAIETCDHIDNNCNETTDEGVTSVFYIDQDADHFGAMNGLSLEDCSAPDGYSALATDCNDLENLIYPGAIEQCNMIDDDCDGIVDDNVISVAWYLDADQDGFGGQGSATVSCLAPAGYANNALDCNDADAHIYPGAAELCNTIDDNCSGTADEGLNTPWYKDQDQDGFGTKQVTTQACTAPPGYTGNALDCDDLDASIYPGATEICNSRDDNCNSTIDEYLTTPWYRDSDQDGFGDASTSTQACATPSGYVSNKLDCNDADSTIKPGAAETCNSKDDNCDAQIDEGLSRTWYIDTDKDGYGSTASSVSSCAAPSGYADNALDCNDTSASINPGASEQCNSIDDDCDTLVDDNVVVSTWYLDQDQDGYGGSGPSVSSCSAPSGYVATNTDCNDLNSNINPGKNESCNTIDDNCNGTTDEGLSVTWYHDADGDTYGSPTDTTSSCSVPTGYVSNAQDCNDLHASVNPGALETCNAFDDNCNGQIDEGVSVTWYQDLDKDGYGNASVTAQACSAPSGYTSNNQDCNDLDASVHPGATEVCNERDDNCNNQLNEGLNATWYQDADRDGYGSPSVTTQACSSPTGYVINNQDCNDLDAAVKPGATEVCNGKDDNCDTQVDEGLTSRWYQDADQDGYGNPQVSTQACSSLSGYVTNSSDCNDQDPGIKPGASEVCNKVDDNCNSQVDEGLNQTYYPDTDADGYGAAAPSIQACTAPAGYTTSSTDCNDQDAQVHPGSTVSECGIGKDYNCDGILGTLLTNGATLSVSMPTVRVTFTVTLGGQPISAANVSATDYGSIRIRNNATGIAFKVGDLFNTTTGLPQGTFTNTFQAGTYDILYAVKVNGPNAPDNQDALLQHAVVLTSDQAVTVDIPYISVGFTTTLGGAPLSTTNTSATDYGTIYLRDSNTLEKFLLYPTWNVTTNVLSATYNTRLVPGTFDILYAVGVDGPQWPANLSGLLQSAVAIQSSQNLTVNVPVVNVNTTITLNGQNVGTANTSVNDYAKIQLRDPATGDVFKLYNTFDKTAGLPVPSFTGQVLPGVYDVLYSLQAGGTSWPINKDAVLKTGVSLTSAATLALPLVTSRLTLSATLGGRTIAGGNTSVNDYGSLRLRDSTLNSFKVFDTWNKTTGAVQTSFSGQVLSGTYDILYASRAGGTRWPLNLRAVLRTGVAITTTQSIGVDIPVATVTCTMTLGGQAISTTNTSATDYGKLIVRTPDAVDRFKLCGAWNTATGAVSPSSSVAIVPGTYDLLFDAEQDGPRWPGNQDVALKTAQTIANGQTVSIDVPVRTVNLAMTVGGAPISAANTSATDFGTIELWNLKLDDDMWVGYSSWNLTTAAVVTPGAIQLLPGSYDTLYNNGADGANWAADQDWLLGCFTIQ